jgi:membrane associated rhomboid family serine protease
MLILPLHHPLDRRSFPLATAALLLLNLFAFFLLQSGDRRALDETARYYLAHGMDAIEAPLYLHHLESSDAPARLARLQALPADLRQRELAQAAIRDRAFRERLRHGELFEDPASHAHWLALDEGWQRLQRRVFTQRYALDADAPDLRGLVGSQFLHGSLGHLLGNMLFLCALGLLVEGALGAWRFLALYLLSGVAAGLAWVAWQGGDAGWLIGASGAIAGLMGALTVLWGLRPIRFFYWFFVVFDYVRAPAILLLPAWLGWELIQMFALPDSQVAYSAHAGGIVAGALLAWGARGAGWVREDFVSDEVDAPGPDDRFAEALAHLGQMRLAEAEALLQPLAAADPARLDVAIARYRAARYAQRGARGGLIERAEAVLDASAPRANQVREQWGVLQDLGKADLAVSPARRVSFTARLAGIGEIAAALELLESVQETVLPGIDLPQQWLRVGLALSERNERELAARALHGLVRRFPDSQQAGKAKFLLKEA